MQSTYIKNFTAANGIFDITVPDFNKVNPSASENSITEANLNVAVNASASFSANIFALPEAEVTPPCETCHFLFEKTFSAGENTFTANLLDLTKSKMNGGGKIFVKIIPKTSASFSASASFTVKLTADRECDFVNRELNTDAYQTFDIGSIGTASVNLRDGSLNFSRNDWSFGGGATAFNLMHIYKGASYDSDEIFSDIHTQAGKGWKTNFHQYLAGNNQNASYVDASGKAHFFDISNGKIYDTSGLGLFLGTVASCKKLSDVNGNEMHFSPQGKLCCINSALGNDLFIGYEASGLNNSSNVNASDIGDTLANTRIAYIQNGNYKATFSYQNDLLSSISYTGSEHSADEVLKFTYIDDRLTKIHKEAQVDGSTVESIQAQFAYTDGRLTRIYGDDYVGLEIVYTADGKVQKVATGSYDGDNLTELTSVAFDYQNGVTFVTDNMGLKFKYTLKSNGDIEKIEEVVSESSLVEVYPDENANDKIQNASYVGSIKLKDIIKMQNTQDNSVVEIDELTESDVISSLYSLYLSNDTTIDFSFNGGRKKVCAIPKGSCKLLDANNNSVVLAQGVFKKESIVKDDSNNNIIKIKTEYSFETQGVKETVTTYAILSSGDSEIKKDVTVINYKGLLVRSEKDDLTTTYTYDSYGNVTSTQITGTDGSVISTQASYSANGESQTSFTDERGKTTNYNYVLPHNVLQKLTYPSGGYEQYTYDAFKEKLTGISAKTALGSALLSQTVNSSKNRVSQAVCGNVTYTFTYNNHGDLTRVSAVNGTNQITVFSAGYNRGNNSYTETINFADGTSKTTSYDKYGDIASIVQGSKSATFVYENQNGIRNLKSRLEKIEDGFAGTETTYLDLENNDETLVFKVEKNNNILWQKNNVVSGNKSYQIYKFNGEIIEMAYKEQLVDENNKPSESVRVYYNHQTESEAFKCDYTRDGLKRVTRKEFETPNTTNNKSIQTYEYLTEQKPNTNINLQTSFIKKELYKYGSTATAEDNMEKASRVYEYDGNGNIKSITATRREENYNGSGIAFQVDKHIYYKYDEMNRLEREDNEFFNKTCIYSYDANGNLSTKRTVAYTTEDNPNYTLRTVYHNNPNFPQVLTRIENNGMMDTITYDENNVLFPKTYKGKNLTWSGSKLASYTKNGTTYSFTYDAFGRKVKKEAGNSYNWYFYDGNSLVGEDWYSSAGTLTISIRYLYDKEGISGFKVRLNGFNDGKFSYYQVTKDILGNIIRIDGSEGKVFDAEYNAFGEINIITDEPLAGVNNIYCASSIFPFRYRGYFYDDSLGLYYLMSRYYDPETGRFISPDAIEYLDPSTIGGLNLYSYCNNNPVMYVDPSGTLFISFMIAALIGAITSASFSVFEQFLTTGNISWAQVGIAALFGAAAGGLAFTGLGGVIGQFSMQGSLSVLETIAASAANGELNDLTAEQLAFSFATGGFFGSIGVTKAAKELTRISQIEGSLVKVLRRNFVKKGFSGVKKAWSKKSAKYMNVFVKSTIKDDFKIQFAETFLNVLYYWQNKLKVFG